jgi:hypothetical protein
MISVPMESSWVKVASVFVEVLETVTATTTTAVTTKEESQFWTICFLRLSVILALRFLSLPEMVSFSATFIMIYYHHLYSATTNIYWRKK